MLCGVCDSTEAITACNGQWCDYGNDGSACPLCPDCCSSGDECSHCVADALELNEPAADTQAEHQTMDI